MKIAQHFSAWGKNSFDPTKSRRDDRHTANVLSSLRDFLENVRICPRIKILGYFQMSLRDNSSPDIAITYIILKASGHATQSFEFPDSLNYFFSVTLRRTPWPGAIQVYSPSNGPSEPSNVETNWSFVTGTLN